MKRTMRTHGTLFCLLIAALAASLSAATPESTGQAAASFDRGNALLAEADFAGAMEAYTAAAKADPENADYRHQAALVRRVIRMRDLLDREQDNERWEMTARALRAFYYANGVHTEALALDRQHHERSGDAESAALLAETELELGMNAEAAALLGALAEDDLTPRSRVLQGIALARLGRMDEAKACAEACAESPALAAGMCFDLACLYSLIGDQQTAGEMLKRCLQSTPPSRVEAMRAFAQSRADLSGLAASPGFAAILATPSNMKESSCSGGTSCGNCPSRGACGGGQEKSGS
jgi:tetratricopeptide (TPR) repeat protein